MMENVSKVSGQEQEDEIGLQSDHKEVLTFCNTWLLALNFQRCKAISCPKYTVGDGLQQHTSEAGTPAHQEDLRISFDENMTFKSYMESKIKAANRSGPDSPLIQIH